MYKLTQNNDPTCTLCDFSRSSMNLVQLLKSKWDELHDKDNLFRYKINNLQEKIVDDKYLLLLNPDRSIKRRPPEQIHNICQPFDKNKFNFTKVSSKEILFNLVKENNDSEIHPLLVNVSPISRYHTLLCPYISKCLPQIITEESLILALDIMFLAQDRDLRIGFNSLCALASVNHLHYHLLFDQNALPVETVKCKQIIGSFFHFEDYPVPAFCVQVKSSQDVAKTSKEIFKLVAFLLKKSIAHNLLISRGESLDEGDDSEVVRVIVWPRKTSAGVKQLDAFNVAVLELSGLFPIFENESYENLQKETLEQELEKWKLDSFSALCEELKLL